MLVALVALFNFIYCVRDESERMLGQYTPYLHEEDLRRGEAPLMRILEYT